MEGGFFNRVLPGKRHKIKVQNDWSYSFKNMEDEFCQTTGNYFHCHTAKGQPKKLEEPELDYSVGATAHKKQTFVLSKNS